MHARRPLLLLPLFAIVAGVLGVAADAAADEPRAAEAGADDPRADVAPAPAAAPRPWLFLDDPTLPRGSAAFTRVTYTQMAARPFAADVAHPGAVVEAGVETSLLPWLSLTASGAGAGDGAFGARGGVRVSFLPASSATHLVAAAGASRDLLGAPGAYARLSFEQELGRARVGAMVHGERAFAAGHDAVDVMVSAGASTRIVGPLRGGVEWVGQDLEGAVDASEAEGGMRHFAGPSASIELLDRRLSLGVGPAFGLSRGSPPFLGRMQAAYAF